MEQKKDDSCKLQKLSYIIKLVVFLDSTKVGSLHKLPIVCFLFRNMIIY